MSVKLLGVFMSNTMIGMLLSMQRLNAVESITCSRLVSASVKVRRSKRFASGVEIRVAIVDAVHLCRLQNDVRANLAGAQGRGRVGGKIRIAGAGDENDDAAQFEMPDGAAEDERLGHVFHFDGGLDASFDADLVERALQGETVDDGREHAHVIRGRAIHPAMAGGQSAPDIAAADDDRSLDAERLHFLDALSDFAHDLRRDVFARAAFAESFAAQFEDDAFVNGRWSFARMGGNDQQNRATLGRKESGCACAAMWEGPNFEGRSHIGNPHG